MERVRRSWTVTSRVLDEEEVFRWGRGLLFGAGGSGLSGGFNSSPESRMPLWELSSEFFFLGKRGERDSAPILAGNVLGDEGLSSGGGRRGLLGRSVAVDSGRLGGSEGTRFKDLRVSLLRKSCINARLVVPWKQNTKKVSDVKQIDFRLRKESRSKPKPWWKTHSLLDAQGQVCPSSNA